MLIDAHILCHACFPEVKSGENELERYLKTYERVAFLILYFKIVCTKKLLVFLKLQ